MNSFQKTKSTQTTGSVSAEKMNSLKLLKFELELIKYVDGFFNCYGNYDSSPIPFKINCF